MLLLWGGYLVVQNVKFTHVVPRHHALKLTAKKITGKKILTIDDVNGQYADWLFEAKRITLNTLDHVAQLGKMTMECKNPHVQIQAQLGTLNLQNYHATVQLARLTHRNMLFTCSKAAYDHKKQKITCLRGKMVMR